MAKASRPRSASALGRRIARARVRKGWNRNQLARAAGVTWANLTRYEEGKNEPGASRILEIAKALDVSLDWLLGRAGAPEVPGVEPLGVVFSMSDNLQTPGRVDDAEFRAVPLVSGSIAAGSARIVDEAIEEYAVIHVSQIAGRGDLVSVRVDREMGRSMVPLIQPGAVVAIDRRDKAIVPEGVYAVRDESGGCTLKRLQWTPPRLWLVPENREEKVAYIDLDGEEPGERIVGRVVWAYQPLV